MTTLAKPLRNTLESTVKAARICAETAARAALQHLGVGDREAPAHLNDEQKALRRRLRTHGRQLGDVFKVEAASGRSSAGDGASTCHLVREVAYEHWHRMLFARFLAENYLLMWEPGASVTLAECAELAADPATALGAKSGWELAGILAARMLPNIFKPLSPALAVIFAPEHQRALEKLLAGLPSEVFTASDSLGWVYQFWQAQHKDEVNASEVKISADELPAVTQLFTEPYMVEFLLHNSLGAWWVSRHPDQPCPVKLDYLREVEAPSRRFDSQDQDQRRDAASTFGYYDPQAPLGELTGNLPHWRQEGTTYFVTFRTADSLPQEKLLQWQEEREKWFSEHPEPHSSEDRRDYRERFSNRINHWLDAGYGECLLRQPKYQEIVENALRYFNNKRYYLDEFVVFSNHVHAIVSPLGNHQLSDIIHSWKSFTSHQINKLTGRSGAFWQKESFDHIVRNPDQIERIRKYIRDHSNSESMVEAPSRRFGYKDQDQRRDAASTIPAAGSFPGWPDSLNSFRLLDPCCGSGHFLVAAFLMLVPMRMAAEGLSAQEAVDAVLRDNLHGLELDPRCVEIAAFALALAAWTYPDADGYRPLPPLNVACCGLKVSAKVDDWAALVPNDAPHAALLRQEFKLLYAAMQDAPLLGSLLDPWRHLKNDLAMSDFGGLQKLLTEALTTERPQLWNEAEEQWEAAVSAQGLLTAARLLAQRYHLVMTNVPYLARGKQSDQLKLFCETHYGRAKNDLANVFLERCLELCEEGRSGVSPLEKEAPGRRFYQGIVQIVMPQNWLFLGSYKKQREHLLKTETWNLLVRLGPGAFDTISGEVVNAILLTLTHAKPADSHILSGLDASAPRTVEEKAALLREAEVVAVEQAGQLRNPDARVALDDVDTSILLEKYAEGLQGIASADYPRFGRCFWELLRNEDWIFQQSTVEQTEEFGGRQAVLYWQKGKGELANSPQARIQGLVGWGRQGIAVGQMRQLPITRYTGESFDNNTAAIVIKNLAHLPAIWCFCSSPEYNEAVRRIDQKLNVTNATLVKVPFDLAHWQQIAAERYPNGLPQPYSDDPTQWIFHGHPQPATDPLQVAVARLLGYRWPAETEVEAPSRRFPEEEQAKRRDGASTLSDEARAWITRCEALAHHVDDDGIACLPPVRGEKSAHERLLALLIDAWETVHPGSWKPSILDRLLADANCAGKSLEIWLRDQFFEQHCKRFHHRPLIWHVWDGLKDGFAALVNYHRLDTRNLERLIHTYLGDWIRTQEQSVQEGVDGAQIRLAAARDLKARLELILEGKDPYDIFVRWKPLDQQPIGWNPDLNDGVRLNIRPFMTAEVLRHNKPPKLNVKWDKDRGKDVESAPWFPVFKGERINDHHLTLAEKSAARQTKP